MALSMSLLVVRGRAKEREICVRQREIQDLTRNQYLSSSVQPAVLPAPPHLILIEMRKCLWHCRLKGADTGPCFKP